MQKCKQLRKLDLTNCFLITDNTILSVAENCQFLEVLILNGCNKLSIEPMARLVERCQALHYMEIKHCLKISDDKMKRLWVRHGKRLKSLNTGRACLEEMEKVREVFEGKLSTDGLDQWRLNFYTGEKSISPKTKNIG